MTKRSPDRQLYDRALELAEAGRPEQALEAIRAYLLTAPRDGAALNDAGVILYELGRHAEAIEHLRRALECAKGRPPETICSLAEAYLAGDRPAEAMELLHVDGSAADARYRFMKALGDAYAAASRLEVAAHCYRRAAALAPHEAEPYIGLGVLALQTDELDRALWAFQIAMRARPDCAEVYGNLAMVYQRKADYPAALEMYLRCLERDADNLVALLGLFQTSCQMGSFSKIIHYLEVYLDKHPRDAAVRFCLATLYARHGWLADARDALRSVLALEPDKREAEELLEQVSRRMEDLQPQGAPAP